MKGEDGARRNISKFRAEYRQLTVDMLPHGDRFLRSLIKPTDLLHAYVNLFVESRRSSAYLTGHIDAVMYPLLICIIIWLA